MFSFTITNCHEDLQVYDFSASQLSAFALQPRPKDVILSAESWQIFVCGEDPRAQLAINNQDQWGPGICIHIEWHRTNPATSDCCITFHDCCRLVVK